MSFNNYHSAIEFINSKSVFNFEESYNLLSYANKLFYISENEDEGRDIIIRLLDKENAISENCKILFNDLIEAFGLYPYVDENLLTGSSFLRYEMHKSPYLKDVYLHEEQFDISTALQSDKSVVLSAPTSFGKSFVIDSFISIKQPSNVVILVPTIALADETRRRLQKKFGAFYKIITSPDQSLLIKIFLYFLKNVQLGI